MQSLVRLSKLRFRNHGGSVMVCGAFGHKLYGRCTFLGLKTEWFEAKNRGFEVENKGFAAGLKRKEVRPQ